MYKIAITMLIVGALAVLFGDTFTTLVLGVTTGGTYVIPVISMLLQFISLAVSSMLDNPYIMNIFYVFLFFNIILVVVQFIRKGTANYFGSLQAEENADYEEDFDDVEQNSVRYQDNRGNVKEVTTTYVVSGSTKYKKKNGKVVSSKNIIRRRKPINVDTHYIKGYKAKKSK